MQNISVLTLSIAATRAAPARTFIAPTGGPAGDGGNALGVAETDSTASGELVPVTVLGTAVVTAGAPIAAGEAIEVGSGGLAVPHTTGVVVARALKAAAAAGEAIEVLLIPN